MQKRALLVLSFLSLSLAVVGWAPLAARAQAAPEPDEEEAPVPPAESAQAARDAEGRGLFEAGRAAFNDGRYEDALDYFQRAYSLSHRSQLLYNIGSANDRLRRDAPALAAFEEYVAEVPDAPNVREVEARIRVLRAAIAEEDATHAHVTPPPPEDEGLSQAERDQLAIEAHQRSQQPAEQGHGVEGEWWFWTIIVGVVAAGVVTGIILGTQNSGGTIYPPYMTGDNGAFVFTLTVAP